MRAARYHFVSDYVFRGDQQTLWDTLTAIERAPGWWKGLRAVEILREPRAQEGIGPIYRNVVRAPIGYTFDYTLEIIDVDPPRRIDVVSTGELVGRGRFRLDRRPNGTLRLEFVWLVGTRDRWITLLTPIARPVFTWNHHLLMTDFGRGLARASGTTLLTSRHSTLRPGAPGFHVLSDARPDPGPGTGP